MGERRHLPHQVGGVVSVDPRIADAAGPSVSKHMESPEVEHHLSPIVEARLTEVVTQLRSAWLAGPALLWECIHPIHEVARSDFERRVAATLAGGFFQFSQFLAGYEVLALQLKERGVVSEQTLLGLEKLLQKSRGSLADEGRVAQGAHSFGDVSRGSDRGSDAADC